jgi:hypothetical protein
MTDMRASDGEREAVVARLNAAVGEGRINIEEFTERVGAVYASRTHQELEPLTADLPVPTVPAAVTAVPGRPEQTIPIGTLKRSGGWRLERDTHLNVVFGTIKLDLRKAFLTSPDITLTAHVTFGTIKVTVPPGVRVEVFGNSVLGSRTINESQAPIVPGAPVLRLRLDTILGSVKVYRRR